MRYGSVCSGIEAATVAWHPIGWEPAFFSEIEKFPRAVLRHHYPDVPLHGDMKNFEDWPDEKIDLLTGGTPCQDISIGYSAGAKRAGDGFDGKRSSLAFCFVGIARKYRPRIILWENVPQVLSKRHAPGFLRFAGQLAECGYHLAWRVLDGRYFGLRDQPRPRLFLVGHTRPGAAAKILLEHQGHHGDSEAKADVAPVLTARGGMAFDDRTPCILEADGRPRIATPLEWERAMGFPDDHTLIPYGNKPADKCPAGPRYKALGNSQDVAVMRWLGDRIQLDEEFQE